MSRASKEKIRTYTRSIARELKAKGPLNIQFLVKGRSVYVIECNLRASRSLPFVCKATGVNLIDLVAPVVMGGKLGRATDVPEPETFAVKAPQFSFLQIDGADHALGVEMRSTGEVACFGKTFAEALSKALAATGHKIPTKGDLGYLLLEPRQDVQSAGQLSEAFSKKGVKLEVISAGDERETFEGAIDAITGGRVSFVLSFNSNSNTVSEPLRRIRRKAVDLQVQLISSREEAEAFLLCME
jgi:carbamoyl-phosphate synthase large subunit